VATYIDNWLVESLGFQINLETNMLRPSQCITFIGLCLDSLQFKAFLSPERIEVM